MLIRTPAVRAGCAALLATNLLSGCGDAAAPAPPQRLTSEEQRLIRSYEDRIARHCVRVARALVDPWQSPTRRQEADAFQAADALLALARAKPRATVGTGQDLRLFVGDVLENLEGSNCDPRMLMRLERGLQEVPPE